MNIYRYMVCKDPDVCVDGQMIYVSFSEAVATAQALNQTVIELAFSFEDSELIEDFREM